MTTERKGFKDRGVRLRDGLARVLRPDLHPVMELLTSQPLTVQDILGHRWSVDGPVTAGTAYSTGHEAVPPSSRGGGGQQAAAPSGQPVRREGLSIDQQLALRSAAGRLQHSFEGVFNEATIERFLHHSYDEFADRAATTSWLPLLAERFARQRLNALARIEGNSDDTRPVVLFLCVHNAGRSQMAMGFFQHLAGDQAIAWSGGSQPTSQVNPAAIAAMAERGIDIRDEFPKPWTDEVVRAADAVITMGCGDACPIFPGKRYEDWAVGDPDGLDLADIRPLRDDIERRVRALLDSLDVTPARQTVSLTSTDPGQP